MGDIITVKKIIAIVTFFIIAFIAIGLGFEYVEKQVEEFNNTPVEIGILGGISENENIHVTMEVSKSWEEQGGRSKIMGAQYDGVIQNTGEYVLRDWSVTIYLPRSGEVDSLWNGEYTEENNTIVITSLDYNHTVEPGGEQTFGFILMSGAILKIANYSVTGYFEMDVEDHELYGVLSKIRDVWLVTFICYVIIQSFAIYYIKKQKHDEEVIVQTMDTFISFVDAKDPYTCGHSDRVASYVRELAKRMRLPKEEVQNCYYIALMHDCGKIGVSDTILNKPGKLTTEERSIMESHTRIGADILKKFTAISGIQEGALHHHERYDGEGYPDRIGGEDISLVARILCVADSFDAMNSDRCYRKRLTREVILDELRINSGKQFDPEIVEHMIDMINEGVVEVVG